MKVAGLRCNGTRNYLFRHMVVNMDIEATDWY